MLFNSIRHNQGETGNQVFEIRWSVSAQWGDFMNQTSINSVPRTVRVVLMSETSLKSSTFALFPPARGSFSLGHDRFDRMINVVFEGKTKHGEKEPLEREKDQNKWNRSWKSRINDLGGCVCGVWEPFRCAVDVSHSLKDENAATADVLVKHLDDSLETLRNWRTSRTQTPPNSPLEPSASSSKPQKCISWRRPSEATLQAAATSRLGLVLTFGVQREKLLTAACCVTVWGQSASIRILQRSPLFLLLICSSVFIDQTFKPGLPFSPSPGRLSTLGVESVIQTLTARYL